MGVTFSTSAFEKQYLSAQDKLEKTMADELTAYINELRKELYQLLLKRTLSKSEYNKIIDKIQSSIGIHTLDVQKNIKDIYIEVLNESRLGNKDYKQAILNYETAKAVNDVTRDFYSAYNDTKQAIDHVKYVMETQSERDKNAIWNNMKNLSREKQQEGIAAYRDLFQKDYEQRIMKELTENPLLNQLITQDDAKLYISLNGKKYDLESYISNRAKYYTTNVAAQIERAVDKEQGWTIFRFVRIEDVNKERPHSIHDNEHNNDVFTTDPNLVGMEFDGKILLDAYKDIPDYPYGEQPPFGCRHVWVGVAKGLEINPDGPNEPVLHNAARDRGYTEGDEISYDNLIKSNNELKLTPKQERDFNAAGKKKLSNKIFKNTVYATKCKVVAYGFDNPSDLGNYIDNTIKINLRLQEDLNKAMWKQKNGITKFTLDEVFALNTYSHEFYHSITNDTYFDDAALRAIKEGLTEWLGREKVKSFIGITVPHGAYDDLHDAISRLIGEKATVKQIKGILQKEDISHIDNDFFKLLGIKNIEPVKKELKDILKQYET